MLCAFDDKRFLLPDGIHTLAYGHHTVPTRVDNDAPAGGGGGATRVLTAAEARNRRIPLRKQNYAPAGQDPKECFRVARRARDATLQDSDVGTKAVPAATALPSTAPARVDAPPPEVLYEYMWDDAF